MRLPQLLTLILVSQPAYGITFVLPGCPPSFLILRVGSGGGTIDQVIFTVPAANVGDGTPVTGAPAIDISLTALACPVGSRTATLTADSSTPLTNGPATVAFTSISWTASDADIPSGTFTGGIQTIVSFLNSRFISNTHTFRYNNAQVLESGAYTGRVTYTLSMP